MKIRVLIQYLTVIVGASTQFVSQDSSVSNSGQVCSVSVKDDFSGFYPMIFDTEGHFWPYTKSQREEATWDLELKNGKEMIVSCAPNYLRNFNNKKSVKFFCNDNKLTNELSLEKKWRDVACELRPVEEIIATVDQCETPSHTGVQFGYVNPVTTKTMIIGHACYSPDKGHTEFVHMKLSPRSEDFDVALQVENENYFARKRNPSGRYKIDLMKAWGDYARNREDSTYIPIEAKRYAMPQNVHWNTLKKLGWNYAFSQEDHNTWSQLQEEVNSMASKRNSVMDYYAGSHGVMKVNGAELYLKDGKFAVPKFMWMMLRDGVQGIVFVVFNKKQMTTADDEEFQGVCSSKCNQVQWLSNSFKEIHQEFFLCCDVSDARAKIPEMPLVTGITRSFLY